MSLYAHNQIIIQAWINDTKSWNSFADSLGQSIVKYGSLTDRQAEAALNSAKKHAAKQVAASAPVEAAVVIEASGLEPILVAFNQAIDSGLKRPKMRLDGFQLKLAPSHGKNAGFLYVMNGEEYMGKISPTGEFAKFSGLDAESTESINAKLALVGANVMEQAVAYGRRTGNCSCCGRPLTDKDSVWRGMGKICAEKFGFDTSEKAPRSPDDKPKKARKPKAPKDGSYFEIWVDQEYGNYSVKKFTPNGYGASSVLAGQVMIEFVDSFETVEEAQAAYPDANFGNKWISQQNTFDHLDDREGSY